MQDPSSLTRDQTWAPCISWLVTLIPSAALTLPCHQRWHLHRFLEIVHGHFYGRDQGNSIILPTIPAFFTEWLLNWDELGNSLVVWWLGLGVFTAKAWVQSLVGELRSHKPCGVAEEMSLCDESLKHSDYQKLMSGTTLVVQWLRLCTPNAGNPGWGTMSFTPQLKISYATTKTHCS